AIDLVREYDDDMSYPKSIETVLGRTDKPIVVLTNVSSAVDQLQAERLRSQGVPVFEGTRSGLRAIGHLLADAEPPRRREALPIDPARRERWAELLSSGAAVDALELIADYGVAIAEERRVATADEAVAAADALGHPVVLKTAAADVRHKVDVDGVRLGLADSDAVRAAYDDLAGRLCADVVVQPQVAPGVELALGIVRDPLLGPLVLVAAGGTLVELMDQRVVALPPIDEPAAAEMLDRLKVTALMRGYRGRPAGDVVAAREAVVAMSQLAGELGDRIAAVDVNPLFVTPSGAVAADALVLPRPRDVPEPH
ncbi:MAG: acetate--CoA ligase family protein, partial [Nocardioidaceae bacterium]